MREKFKRFCDTANPDLLRLVIIFVLVGLLLAGFLLFGRSGNENSVMPAWEQAEHVEPPDERLAAAQKENPDTVAWITIPGTNIDAPVQQYFDVDVPLRGERYGSSDAHDWTTNSGLYYLREVSAPDSYLIEQSVIPVEFTYENQFIAWQVVDCLHSDKQTTVEIDKRALTSDSDDTFVLTGATLTVTDWNDNVVDTWESGETAHMIRGLHLSHDFAGNRDTTKIYTLTETRPADGYTTARSIQFRLEQATDDNGYLQETAVWVLRESEDAEYRSGSIISPTAFSDDTVATIPAKLRAFWDKLLGKNPDTDGVVIANWYCVNGTLVVNFTDAANDRAIAKCLRESDFSDLTFDKVYLTGAAAPAFFADKQVADKPADAEITYSASWILLKNSDGFSQTVTMLDAPTRVKISKADIATHEEIPGATLRVLDKDGSVVDEWVSEDTPHYMEAVLVAGRTYHVQAVSLLSVEQMSNGMLYAVWAIPTALLFLGIGAVISRRVFAKHQVS